MSTVANEVSFSSKLFVVRGKDRGRHFELSSRSTSIGRHGSNEIQLLDGKASRRHAEIIFEGARHKLVDLKSSNGTYLNNQRVEVAYLSSGDKISIGNSVLLFTEGLSISSDASSSSIKLSDSKDIRAGQSRVLRSLHAESIPEFSELISTDSSLGMKRIQRQLRILYSASLGNATATDIDEILQRMLDMIFEMLDARYGAIMLTNEEQGLDVKLQVRKVNDDRIKADQYEIPRVILERALEKDQGILASRSVEFDGILEQRQVICTPMYGRYGRVGLIYIEGLLDFDDGEEPTSASDSQLSKGFSDEQLKMIIAIGHQAGIAIEDKIFSNALIHSERMSAIGEIVAMLAHQVKNIMQGINGGGYMIKKGLADNEPPVIEQGWKIVEKNQGRISDLILDMLSFSKDRQPNLELTRVKDLVGEAIEMVSSYAEEYQVSIENELPDHVQLLVDKEMITRAVHNLLLNGIDACAENQGTIKIRMARDQDHYLIDFQDNGVGIKKSNLARIFSPFKSTKGGRGTGLGLTIARKSCREHGGDVTVKSTFGKGSTFRISLPVRAKPEDLGQQDGGRQPADHSLTQVFDFKEP